MLPSPTLNILTCSKSVAFPPVAVSLWLRWFGSIQPRKRIILLVLLPSGSLDVFILHNQMPSYQRSYVCSIPVTILLERFLTGPAGSLWCSHRQHRANAENRKLTTFRRHSRYDSNCSSHLVRSYAFRSKPASTCSDHARRVNETTDSHEVVDWHRAHFRDASCCWKQGSRSKRVGMAVSSRIRHCNRVRLVASVGLPGTYKRLHVPSIRVVATLQCVVALRSGVADSKHTCAYVTLVPIGSGKTKIA